MIVMNAVVSIFARADMNVRMRMHRTGVGVRMHMDDQVLVIR